jgi:hypothetical protein
MSSVREKVHELANRVSRNVPDRHNPESFHIEKSEIAAELRDLAEKIKPKERRK